MKPNKKPTLTIRKFTPNDAKPVSNLTRKTLNEVNSKDYPQEVIQFLCENYSPQKIVEKSQTRLLYIAEDNDRIVGTVSLKDNIILAMFVDPMFHHQGIGTQLMQRVETVAREKGYCVVNVPSSVTAYEFYKRRGYQMVKSEYTPKYGQVILMEKAL